MSETNCPFYGRTLLLIGDGPFVMVSTHGNQCGLITKAFAPCEMEITGAPIDWKTCPHVHCVMAWEEKSLG